MPAPTTVAPAEAISDDRPPMTRAQARHFAELPDVFTVEGGTIRSGGGVRFFGGGGEVAFRNLVAGGHIVLGADGKYRKR